MADIKYSELATKANLILTDLLAVSDTSGTLYKSDLQTFSNLFSATSGVDFKGSLSISDAAGTPADGWYFPSENGDYIVNSITKTVVLTNNINILIIGATHTTFEMLVIPVTTSLEDTTYDATDNVNGATMNLSYKEDLSNGIINQYPCFLLNDDSINVKTEVNSTPRYLVYQSFKELNIYGSDNSKRHKITLFRVDESGTGNYRIIIYREETAGNWSSIYDYETSTITVNADGVTRWDYTNNGIRIVSDIDYTLLPSGTSTGVDGGNNNEPSYIIKYDSLKTFAELENENFKFNCFLINDDSIDLSTEVAGINRYTVYNSFKFLDIQGSDRTKNHKLSLFRIDESGTNVYQLWIYREETAGSWSKVYDYSVVSLTVNADGVTRWDYTNNGIRLVTDLDLRTIPSGTSSVIDGNNNDDPAYIINPLCISEVVSAGSTQLDLPTGTSRPAQVEIGDKWVFNDASSEGIVKVRLS